MRVPCGGENVYNNRINVNILAAIEKNWIKNAWDLSIIFYNCMRIGNYLKISLIKNK